MLTPAVGSRLHACKCTAPGPGLVVVPLRTAVVAAASEYDYYADQGSGPTRTQGGGGRGRGGGGARYGGNSNGYSNNQQQERGYGGYQNPAGYNARRGPVSYDEDNEGGGSYSRGGGRGGRGGGRTEAGGQRARSRPVTAEMAAVNDAINNAQSWRELQTVMEQQNRAGMPGLDAFQLVYMLLRLVSLENLPTQGDDAADFQQFVASLYGWVMDKMPQLKPKQISGALHAIGKLNLYNAELVGALVQASYPQMGDFAAVDFVRMLDGLERMGAPPSPEWVTQFWSVSANKIVRTAEKDQLAVMFSLCRRLGMTPTAEWLAATAPAAMEQIANRNHFMRADTFVKLLAGLASVGWRPDQQQLAVIVDRSFPQLQQGYLHVKDMVELAWALSQWETPMPANWAKVFNSCVQRQRRFFRPASLGSLLYSLAYLRAGPEPGTLKGLLDDLAIQYDDATGDDLANIAMALVQFQYSWTNDRLMDEFLIAIKQKLPTCSATGLNNIISALPAMGSGYRLNEVVREAVSRYDALMSAQQYSGAAAVEAADQQQYEAMAAAEAQPVA